MTDVPAPPVPNRPLPPELVGGYQALRAIAHTRIYDVLLVESVEQQHKLVWKVLRPEATQDPEALGRFIDEAGLVQELVHPNIVRSLGAGRLPDGAYYLATEFLEGQTLRKRLDEGGALSPKELLDLLVPVCDALLYMHARGVVHRDLRPEKIFLTAEGPRLLDFGLAHFGGNRSVVTAPGVLLARPAYTPPECIMGHRADARGDIYALGITLFEALCGKPPFEGPDGEVLSQQLSATPPALPPLARLFQPIVDRCLAKEPGKRFDAKELAAALKDLAEQPGAKVDVSRVIQLTAMLDGFGQGDVLGNYRIEEMLGDGGMGQVFRARHLKLDRDVAIKLLKPQQAQSEAQVERFFREARVVNRIKHEHIIEIHDFVDEKLDRGVRRSYCVMELLEGLSLAALMTKKPLPISRAVRLVRQAASALQAAHDVGVTHRDVKPDNLFITQKSGADFVKVLDFGVAKLAGPDDKELVSKTLAGHVIGTPAYMAPEQVQGLDVGPACDVYALGTVLYEVLSGKRPFAASGYLQLAMQISTELPPPMPLVTPLGEQIAPQLAAIVMRCLSKAPALRFGSMKELSDALAPYENWDGYADHAPPADDAALAKAAGVESRSRRRMPLFAAAAVLVIGTGFFALRPGAEPPREPIKPLELPTRVAVTVRSKPFGAVVMRTDTNTPLGMTPTVLVLPPSSKPVPLELRLEGYAPQSIAVVPDRDSVVELALASAPKIDPLPTLPVSEEVKKPARSIKKLPAGRKTDTLDPYAQ